MQRGVRSSACLLLFLSGRKETGEVPDSSGAYMKGHLLEDTADRKMATARLLEVDAQPGGQDDNLTGHHPKKKPAFGL